MSRYFGTDGLRGRVGELLNEDFVVRLANAIADFVGSGIVYIGRDTRPSGEWIEQTFIDAFTATGIKVKCLGIIPTTALSYIVANTDANLGVMITASHNPEPWNGVKIFDATGRKLKTEEVLQIERNLD